MTASKKLKVAVYTCNVGNYDIILPPRVPANGVQYYCFTDRPQRRISGWKMLPLVQLPSVNRLDLVNRYHKFFPHRVLPGFDCSIYIDARIQVVGDILPWVEKWAKKNVAMICMKHPFRSTIFEEAERCEERGLFDSQEKRLLQQQLSTYYADGMPPNQELSQNSILLRFHDAPGLDESMELWWHHLLAYTRRDQISLPYILWKTELPAVLTDDIDLLIYIRRDLSSLRHISSKTGLPTALPDDITLCTSKPYFISHGHRRSGLKGLWQLIHLRRDNVWWYDVLCRIEWKLYPIKKVLRTLRGVTKGILSKQIGWR